MGNGVPTIVIVGDPSDPHTSTVLQELAAGSNHHIVVFDLATLPTVGYAWSDRGVRIQTADGGSWIEWKEGSRGWVRRISPPFWQHGIAVESIEAAETTAWLTLLGGIVRTTPVQWLTDIDPLMIGENKMLQASVAKQLGVSYPRTLVTSDPAVIREKLPSPVVVKPLGPGHFFDESSARVIYAQSLASNDEALQLLSGAPFLVQEKLVAQRHWRIATVRGRIWAASLNAKDRPVDWRSESDAHHSFQEETVPDSVASDALRIAQALALGYSSQDWIETSGGFFLLDVNPGGQWLFLPRSMARSITSSIVAWLKGEGD